ncbi:response regulator [Muricoccus aerilatus]|uniref:response regulator n=1 Tax=Muricoccus aerilatus TaxID=452982 RepID=UPI0005C165D0|nr:response regulator [Roseomonas aerilata]
MPDTGKLLVGRRILLVEDEYSIAVEMERWLIEAGAKVLGPVPSVEQAVELIGEEMVGLDGAVLDINLGEGETVYPVADRLNELGVPYLFTTGDMRIGGNPAHRERPRLAKPVLRAELITAIANLLHSQARTV